MPIDRGEKCSCEPDFCAKGVNPANDCIMRLDGVVVSARCEVCNGETWHHNGACVACLRRAEAGTKGQRPPRQREVVVDGGTEGSPFQLVVQIAGGKKFTVSQKRKVADILKIILEG